MLSLRSRLTIVSAGKTSGRHGNCSCKCKSSQLSLIGRCQKRNLMKVSGSLSSTWFSPVLWLVIKNKRMGIGFLSKETSVVLLTTWRLWHIQGFISERTYCFRFQHNPNNEAFEVQKVRVEKLTSSVSFLFSKALPTSWGHSQWPLCNHQWW